MSDSQQSRNNLRRSKRKAAKGRVRASCYRGPWEMGTNLALSVLDLSETGVRLLLKEAVTVGQEVSIILESPTNARSVKRTGTVAWSASTADGKPTAGINFHKVVEYRDLLELT